jgi:hypothetical protein
VADAYIGPRSADYALGQLIDEGAAVIEELTRGMRVEADDGLYEYIGEARWEDVDLRPRTSRTRCCGASLRTRWTRFWAPRR